MQIVRSLTEVARTGDRRATLEALRDIVARTIDLCTSPRDLPPLARRLESIVAELDAMPANREGNPVDEIAARAAKRRADATNRAGSAV